MKALDWDTIDPAPKQAATKPGTDAEASWAQYDAPPVAAKPAAQPADWGAAKNFVTGLLKVPGAVIGLPHMIGHTANWAQAQFGNGVDAVLGGPGGHTGAEFDKLDPVMRVLPSSADVDKVVEKGPAHPKSLDWFFNSISDPTKEASFYEPTSPLGQMGQAAVTAGATGFRDPKSMATLGTGARAFWDYLKGTAAPVAKMSAAGGTAQGSQQLFPDTPALAAATALLTHAGASGVEAVARNGGGMGADAARQVVQPARQGEREAGQVFSKIDNAQPGLANPADADLVAIRRGVQQATDDIGPGLPDWQAGAELRRGLQARVDQLVQSREAATAPLREARDASPALVHLDPVLELIDQRLKVAAGAQQSALEGALKDLHLNDGSLRDHAEQLAASRTAINARIGDAKRAGDDASAAHLMEVRKLLDTQIAKAVPEAAEYTRQYAEHSKPLRPAEYGPVGRVLERDQFNSRFTLADERIPDAFLRSSATRADLNQLIAAHGGDKAAALNALEQHMAGVAQRAIQPDGTLDAVAFGRAMRPYEKSLKSVSMWFPELGKKFTNAQAAQRTLDTMTAQRGLADAVSSGALRDAEGVVTGRSFSAWLKANKADLTRTQDKAAIMRLDGLAKALQSAKPGDLADALKSEALPAVAGSAFGGLEAGVLGVLLHKTSNVLFSGRDAKRMEAFSAAIEQAVTNPAYAARLAAEAAKHRRTLSPTRALVRAVLATPLAFGGERER